MPAAPAKTGGHAPLFGRLLALAAAGAAGASATAGVPRAVLDGGAGTNASLRVPEDARCLLWQGGELGCGAVRDRDVCLRSADGRPWMQWRGHRIYGQPCAWCGGENCTANTGELCMPADWVRGRPRIEVAGCGLAPRARARASAERHGGGLLAAPPAGPAAYGLVQFEGPGRSGFACGAEGAAASAKVNNLFYTFTARSVDECKRLCSLKGYCRAMEYQAHDGRCLLWWYPVQSMEPRPGHTCALVRSRNGSGVTVTASALTPEEPRAATHGGLSEREEALVGSVVGSIVGVAVGAAGARAHAAAAGLSTGLTDALEKDLRSTLTTTTAALVRLNATEAKAAASNPSRDMLTVIPSAGESVGSILRPSDTSNGTASGTAAASNTRNGTASGTAVASNTSNGTASGTAVAATTSNGTASLTAAASNTSNGTASGTAVAARSEAADQDPGTWRWAAMGAALCGCAACALGVAAVRAARPRATRAADLELKEEDEENSDDDAHLSDDLEAALAAAAAGPAGAGAPTQHRAAPLPRLLGPALRPPCGLLKRPAAPARASYAPLPTWAPADAAPRQPAPTVRAAARPARPAGPAAARAPAAALQEPVAGAAVYAQARLLHEPVALSAGAAVHRQATQRGGPPREWA